MYSFVSFGGEQEVVAEMYKTVEDSDNNIRKKPEDFTNKCCWWSSLFGEGFMFFYTTECRGVCVVLYLWFPAGLYLAN